MPKIAISTASSPAISKLDFLKRFTFEERVAMEIAAETDPEIRVVREGLRLAEYVRLDDPETIMGLAFYVGKGLITETRKVEILS